MTRMTRRMFLRWLLGSIAAGLGTYGLWRWLRPGVPRAVEAGNLAKTEPVPLTQAGGDTALLSFFILSDLHVGSGGGYQSEHLRKALNDMKAFKDGDIEALILGGDLTESGTDADYQQLRSVLAGYELPPTYANLGNHEYYDIWIDKKGRFNHDTKPNGKTDAGSREKFMRFFGMNKPYQRTTINGYTILLLSQEVYVQEKPEVGEGAWYSDEQMAWFRAEMAKHDGEKPIFVIIHQPLPPVGRDGSQHQLIRAKEFRDILKPHRNVFVVSGHTHQDFTNGRQHYVKESFHWFHNSSVGRVLSRDFKYERKEAAQGLYVQIYADKVLLRGREFSTGTWIEEANWSIPIEVVKQQV